MFLNPVPVLSLNYFISKFSSLVLKVVLIAYK